MSAIGLDVPGIFYDRTRKTLKAINDSESWAAEGGLRPVLGWMTKAKVKERAKDIRRYLYADLVQVPPINNINTICIHPWTCSDPKHIYPSIQGRSLNYIYSFHFLGQTYVYYSGLWFTWQTHLAVEGIAGNSSHKFRFFFALELSCLFVFPCGQLKTFIRINGNYYCRGKRWSVLEKSARYGYIFPKILYGL